VEDTTLAQTMFQSEETGLIRTFSPPLKARFSLPEKLS